MHCSHPQHATHADGRLIDCFHAADAGVLCPCQAGYSGRGFSCACTRAFNHAGRALLQQGFRIPFDSAYLRERNWVQIAWMGDTRADAVLRAVVALL